MANGKRRTAKGGKAEGERQKAKGQKIKGGWHQDLAFISFINIPEMALHSFSKCS
jgi:hypothetical protein